MRFLTLSFLFILLSSCSPYPVKMGFQSIHNNKITLKNEYFSNPSLDYIYKASINAFGKDFSGVLIVKKINAEEKRVVFTTEMGTTLFDFSFFQNKYVVNYIIEEINKKVIIKKLQHDFKILITERLEVEENFRKDENLILKTELDKEECYYFFTERKLRFIKQINNGKERIEFQFSKINNNIAQNIKIAHKNLPITIQLTSIF